MIVLMVLLTVGWSNGMPKKKMEPSQQQRQQQGQAQGQQQDQGQSQISNAAAAASASSQQDQANQQNISSNYEAQAPDIVLIPNNNTENCLRIWGLSFSTTSGGAGIGIPWRSKKCDFEAAADDAFAQGQIKMGWYWKCKNKNLYKGIGSPEDCLSTMLKLYIKEDPQPPIITPPVQQCCTTNCDHDDKHERIFEKCQEK